MYVSRSGNSADRRYLVLVAVLFATLFASPLYAVNVSVDIGNLKAVLPHEGLGIGTAVYANNFANPNLDERLNEAGVTTLRYSGGGYADVYHWSEHKDSPFGGTTDRGYVAPATTFPGLLNIMNNMGNNAQAVITVNYGSALKLNGAGTQADAPNFGGQPKEAAAWVAYANADASIYGTANDIPLGIDQQGNDWKTAGYWAKLRASTAAEYQTWATTDGNYNSHHNFLAINRDAPAGVKYWEIGNETFGTGYYGGGNGYSTDYHLAYGTNRDDHVDLSPAHYGDQVVAYANLMKQVDPTIKIGTVLATPPDDYSWSYADLNDNGSKGAGEPFWNDEVLQHAASVTDFVMVHWYPYIGEAYFDYDNSGTFNAGDQINDGTTQPHAPLNWITPLLQTPRVKINQMINGTTSGLDAGTNRGVKDSLTAYGIPNADIMVTEFNYFGQVANLAGVNAGATYRTEAQSLFVADSYASWLEAGVKSVQLLELSKDEFLNGDQYSLTTGSEYHAVKMLNLMADPGDQAVASTSSSNDIRVHSVLQDDGTVAVMILNMGLATANVDVAINGATLASDGIRYSTFGTGITTTPVSGLGNSFTVSNMPGHMNYLFVIPLAPPPPVLLGDFNDDGVVDALDYTVWRNNFGDATEDNINNAGDGLAGIDEADFDLWKLHYGEMAPPPGGGGLAAIPEPASMLLLLIGGSVCWRPRRRA